MAQEEGEGIDGRNKGEIEGDWLPPEDGSKGPQVSERWAVQGIERYVVPSAHGDHTPDKIRRGSSLHGTGRN